MKLIKDILILDMETTGPDPDRDSILQLSGSLLDKDNLLEKTRFNQYVKISFLESTIQMHANHLNIPVDQVRKSKKIYEVSKEFAKTFGTDLILATHNNTHIVFLRNAFKKSLIPFEYNKHSIDVWTLGYIYTLRYGLKKMPSLNTLYDAFHLKLTKRNNSAERLGLTAEVFRRMVQNS